MAVDDAGLETGEPQGLAHLREWVRPLRGVIAGNLDDLYVDPGTRGTGAVEALFAEINRIALITYDMTPTADPTGTSAAE